DLRVQAVAVVVALVTSIVLYRPFVALAFDQRKAELLGMRPRLARAALLGLIGLVVVTAFRTVGSLLVFGLMVAPASTATLLVRRVPAVMTLSLVLGMAAVVLGLEMSYHLDLAGSAAIAAVAVGQFFVILAVRSGQQWLQQRRAPAAAPLS
ncbi:MAG TPA: metal ABC transporter permease, partial [Euzebya sp.]|nr:metal ABC transporter permease [Euzebya sp.]